VAPAEIKPEASWPVSIFIAGGHAEALELCRGYCDLVGLCVTVTPTTYVYTHGQEAGVIVGLVNYPRFPASRGEIEGRARDLAELMLKGLGQQSYSIQTPCLTTWVSYREQEA
jgi:hypothetical protein